jgi:prepilin-type N-terminal cleavage/methylation domain-containing protein
MKRRSQKSGFTLVEMLIVVSIIIVLAAGMFANSFLFKDQAAFKLNYNKFVSILQEARNLALSSQSYGDTDDYDGDGLYFDPDEDMILPNGYIVNFNLTGDKPVITLYADLFSSATNELDPAEDQLLKTLELDENITITPEAFTQLNNVETLPNAGDFSVIYTTPDANFQVLDIATKTTVQFKISQTDDAGTDVRSKYIFMQYLYGIPELMDNPYIVIIPPAP